MNKLVVAPMLVFAAACGPSQSVPPACSDGEERCNGTSVELCRNGAWAQWSACAACESSAGAPLCWQRVGFEVASPIAYADAKLVSNQQEIRSESGGLELVVQNFGSKGAKLAPGFTGQVSISGGETKYSSCGLCVFAFADGKAFFAESGAVQVEALPANVGENLSVTLHGVVLREVDAASMSTEVANGDRWKIDGAALSAAAGPFPCDTVGAFSCSETNRLVDCAAAAAPVPYAHLELADDCVSAGRDCVSAGVSTPACAETCSVDQDLRCSAAAIEHCSGGHWLLESMCAAGTQECVASPGPPRCADTCTSSGAARCGSNNVLESCDGSIWQFAADCTASFGICDSGTASCVSAPCSTAGALRCSGDQLLRCDSGSMTWQSDHSCAPFWTCDETGGAKCVNTACSASDDAARCAENTPQACDSGTWKWVDGTSCGLGVCVVDGAGAAATTRCAESCLFDGIDALRCTSAGVEWCDGTIWSLRTACTSLEVCDSSGTPTCLDTCTSAQTGNQQCRGNVIETCDGTRFVPGTGSADCNTTCQTCAVSGTTASCGETCPTEGATCCAPSGALRTCSSATWTNSTCDAGSGLACGIYDPAAGAALCTEACANQGRTRCTGNLLERCDGKVWQLSEDCAATPGGTCGSGMIGFTCHYL